MTTAEMQRIIVTTPDDLRVTPEFARLLNDVAVESQELQPGEPDAYFKLSQTIWEKTLGPNHPYVALSLSNRAALYRKAHVFDEAERVFQLAQSIWKKTGQPIGDETQPLSAERFEPKGVLEHYGSGIRDLRSRVEAGSAGARAELVQTITHLGPWYHNVHFSGAGTNGVWPDFPESRWQLIAEQIPSDLRGKSVLDIGCNSGFFSLQAKRRGADRVVGIDIMPYNLAQARFASHWHSLPLELWQMDVYDVGSLDMTFDIILFLGVLYHLKHPLYALEKLASICRESMFMVSDIRGGNSDFHPADDYSGNEISIFDDPGYPRMYFIENSYNGDESNWWMPTHSCLKAMARVSGFKNVEETKDPRFIVCRK